MKLNQTLTMAVACFVATSAANHFSSPTRVAGGPSRHITAQRVNNPNVIAEMPQSRDREAMAKSAFVRKMLLKNGFHDVSLIGWGLQCAPAFKFDAVFRATSEDGTRVYGRLCAQDPGHAAKGIPALMVKAIEGY